MIWKKKCLWDEDLSNAVGRTPCHNSRGFAPIWIGMAQLWQSVDGLDYEVLELIGFTLELLRIKHRMTTHISRDMPWKKKKHVHKQ
jgi:hypothetical protein